MLTKKRIVAIAIGLGFLSVIAFLVIPAATTKVSENKYESLEYIEIDDRFAPEPIKDWISENKINESSSASQFQTINYMGETFMYFGVKGVSNYKVTVEQLIRKNYFVEIELYARDNPPPNGIEEMGIGNLHLLIKLSEPLDINTDINLTFSKKSKHHNKSGIYTIKAL